MKRFFILLFVVTFISSCEEYDISDQGFDLKELPGYVAFDAPGTTVEEVVEDVNEEDEPVSLTIETPTGSLSDITIDYEFGGDAVFGTDFNVDGASASGGSIVLKVDPEDFQNIDNVDLEIELLTDNVNDGDKVLTITLLSATNADGETFQVGRGGTDLLKTATVNIVDVDCAIPSLAGDFDVVTTNTSPAGCEGVTNTVTVIKVSDNVDGTITYRLSDVTGGLYKNCYGASDNPGDIVVDGVNITMTNQPDVVFGGDVFNGTGTIDPCNGFTIMWSNGFGDAGTSVHTFN